MDPIWWWFAYYQNCVNHNKKLFRRSPLCPLLLNSEDTVDGLYLLLPYSLVENFRGFCLTLKILLSKILMLPRRFLKLISSLWFKLTVPLVTDILSVHYLWWLAKPWKVYHENLFLKENHSTSKFLILENFRLYSILIFLTVLHFSKCVKRQSNDTWISFCKTTIFFSWIYD